MSHLLHCFACCLLTYFAESPVEVASSSSCASEAKAEQSQEGGDAPEAELDEAEDPPGPLLASGVELQPAVASGEQEEAFEVDQEVLEDEGDTGEESEEMERSEESDWGSEDDEPLEAVRSKHAAGKRKGGAQLAQQTQSDVESDS